MIGTEQNLFTFVSQAVYQAIPCRLGSSREEQCQKKGSQTKGGLEREWEGWREKGQKKEGKGEEDRSSTGEAHRRGTHTGEKTARETVRGGRGQESEKERPTSILG